MSVFLFSYCKHRVSNNEGPQPNARAEGKTLYSFEQLNCYAFFPYFRHMLHFNCKHIELAMVKLVILYDKLVKKLIHSYKSYLISK